MRDPIPRGNYSVPNVFALNPSQNEAVARALKYKCSVIQGPPGTGKTETAAAIIYHILRKCRSQNSLIQMSNFNQSLRNREETIARERGEYSTNINDKQIIKNQLEHQLILAIIEAGKKRINLLRSKPKPKGNNRWRGKFIQEELNNATENVKKAECILKLISSGAEYDVNFIRDMINHQFCNFEKDYSQEIPYYLRILQEIAEPFTSSVPDVSELARRLYEYLPTDRILVTTFSNTAIKVLKQRLISKGIDSIQIYAKIQEETDENINDEDSLHYKLRNNEEYKNVEKDIKEFEEALNRERKKSREYYEGKISIEDLLRILDYFNSQWREVRERNQRTQDIDYALGRLEIYSKVFEYLRQVLQGNVLLIDNINHSIEMLCGSLVFFRQQEEIVRQQETQIRTIEKSIEDLIIALNSYLDLLKSPEAIQQQASLEQTVKELQEQLNILKIHKQEFKNKLEKDIISQYSVVCCTCLSSYGPRLNHLEFKHILIDEATQALEPVSALCLLKRPVHLVLLGDPRQLGCLVKYTPNTELGLAVPMIERLMDSEIPCHLLSQQYRMHPEIAAFSNRMFYSGQIQNTVTEDERSFDRIITSHPTRPNNFSFPDPINDKHTFFINVDSQEEHGGSGTSYLNRNEAEALSGLVSLFYESYVDASQIGIITFYESQRGYILNYLAQYFDPENYTFFDSAGDDGFLDRLKPNIMSVDSCQGKEFDFVILSCVRSSDSLGIGFLNNPQRMNVAMTRARFGLIVVGNANSLLKTELGEYLIKFYGNKNLIFQGDINPSTGSIILTRIHLNLTPFFDEYVIPTIIRYRN